MKLENTIKNAAIFILLIMVTILSLTLYFSKSGEKTTRNSTIVMDKISSLSELSSIKYTYKNVAMFKDVKTFSNLDIPFTRKSFIISYSGYVKAGVDLKDVQVITNEIDSVEVILKKAVILDNIIDENSVEIYDETSGLFNRLSYTDLFNVLSDEKAKIGEELKNNGFLNEAESKIKLLLESFLKNMGFKNITIEFK